MYMNRYSCYPQRAKLVLTMQKLCPGAARLFDGGNSSQIAENVLNYIGNHLDEVIEKFPIHEDEILRINSESSRFVRELVLSSLGGYSSKKVDIGGIDDKYHEKIEEFSVEKGLRLNKRRNGKGKNSFWADSEVNYIVEVATKNPSFSIQELVEAYQDYFGSRYRTEDGIKSEISRLRTQGVLSKKNVNWKIAGGLALYQRKLAQMADKKWGYLEHVLFELESSYPGMRFKKENLAAFYKRHDRKVL